VYAGFGDDDGPVAVQELTPSVGIAETFGKWQGRCEPLDCFAHVGVVQHGHYGGIWCRAVLLQHRIGGYQCFPGRLTMIRRKFVSPISAFAKEGFAIKRKHDFFIMGAGARLSKPKLQTERKNSSLFELARVLMCFDHVASFIVNANHSIV
jgi:hypothetical protein